jgi:hypothetical protein
MPHTAPQRVEAARLVPDPLQLLVVGLIEVVEHFLFVIDRIFYGLAQILLSFRVRGAEDEYLSHQSYSVYLEAFPLTRSAGYFCPLIVTFDLAASTGSMSSLSANSVR